MSPFACDTPRSIMHPLIEDESAPGTRSKDHAKNRRRPNAGPVDGLRQSKAVRIVGDPDRLTERTGKVLQ